MKIPCIRPDAFARVTWTPQLAIRQIDDGRVVSLCAAVTPLPSFEFDEILRALLPVCAVESVKAFPHVARHVAESPRAGPVGSESKTHMTLSSR
jgi:hypothetical protein